MLQKFKEIESKKSKNDSEEMGDTVKDKGYPVMKKHQQFLDRVFEIIINHPYPIARFSYWKDLGPEYK